MARFMNQPCLEIKDVFRKCLDFLLNMIRRSYELLVCCHRGTCVWVLDIIIIKASIWLFQCITPWLQNCVGGNLTATDTRSVSALLKKHYTPDLNNLPTWLIWRDPHTESLQQKSSGSRTASRPRLIETKSKIPSTECILQDSNVSEHKD